MSGGWQVQQGGASGGWQVHDIEWGHIIGDILDQTDLINYLAGNYLKLDQTTPQTIINGAPLFEDGIRFMSLNGKLWLVTMDNAGAFVITDVSPVTLNPRRSSLWFLMPYVSSV